MERNYPLYNRSCYCSFLLSSALVLTGLANTLGAATAVFNPTDDAHVRKDKGSTNYGSSATMQIRESGSSRRRAFVQFAVNVPRLIESATLRIYSLGSSYTLTPVQAGTGWDEDTLTFDTIPEPGAVVATGQFIASSGWVEFDLTDHVSQNGIYSFELASTGNGSDSVSVNAKEAAEFAPELVVEYSDTNSSPVFADQTLNIGGIRSGFAFQGSFATQVFEPDSGDSLTLSKVAGSFTGPGNDWLNVASDGSVSGTPDLSNVGVNQWTIEADDGYGPVTATLEIHVLDPSTPNILYILVDDLGYADVSANGYSSLEYTTPNIDTIFSQGVQFQAGFVSNSVCAPSRAGLLTGRSGSRFGFESNIPSAASEPGSLIGLDPNQKTIPDALKVVGYKTFGIGKWHLGENDALFHPNVRGFDHFFGMRGGSRSYTQMMEYDRHDSIEENSVWVEEPYGIYITDFLTDKAIDYISDQNTESPGQPWFMYMSYTAPHGPMHAKRSDMDRVSTPTTMSGAYADGQFVKLLESDGSTTSSTSDDNDELRQVYCAMVISLDDNVGRLLAKLEELNIDENTLVVFHSDNGGPEIGKNWSRNNPLKGSKGSLWEGGIRVPFAISWPGTISGGQVFGNDSPISAIDLMPTFARVSGADQVQAIETDGIDLMPLLTGSITTTSPRSLYWRRGQTEHVALRYGDYKYYHNRAQNEIYVFDHGSSTGESGGNLANSDPALLAELESRFAAYEATLPDPHWQNMGVPAIITYTLDDAPAGAAYSMSLNHASDLPVTWSITSGKPDWLNIDPATGQLTGTPNEADAYYNLITLQTSDGVKTSSYQVPLRVNGSNNISLADWQDVYDVEDAQLSVDIDGDGMNSLLEYALGGNPKDADVVEMPILKIDLGSVTFEHLRRKNQVISYDVEVSADLVTWASADILGTQVEDLGDGFERVDLNLELAPGIPEQKFARLRISE